jgi:hypothetical protein
MYLVYICRFHTHNELDVPSFLFDVIPKGSRSRQIAGFLLWVHVSVSFAINSQALCSSIDRTWFQKTKLFSLHSKHATRWALLSLLLSVSSYIVANAIPFFGVRAMLDNIPYFFLSCSHLSLYLGSCFFHRRFDVSPAHTATSGYLPS